MRTLVVAEHNNKIIKNASFHTLTAALALKHEIDFLIIGKDCNTIVDEAIHLPISRVLLAEHADYEHQLAENCAQIMESIAREYTYILAPATTFGKNLLPRLAALLDMAMLSDVIEIISEDSFVRPIYAGNVLTTVESKDQIKLMTIRTTAFPAAEKKSVEAPVERLTQHFPNTLSHFEKEELTQTMRPELTTARIIISGGRGLKSAENFRLLESIADELGAAIGASRAAVDAGFAPNDYQVGQTGKVVAPDLYIAVGISGAIQHLAGMKDSKVIVAINNDPDAPIIQAADYVLVDDLFKVLPALEKALHKA